MTVTQLLGRGKLGRTRTSSSSRGFFLESGINRHQRGLRTAACSSTEDLGVAGASSSQQRETRVPPVSHQGRGSLRAVKSQEESISEQSHSKNTSLLPEISFRRP